MKYSTRCGLIKCYGSFADGCQEYGHMVASRYYLLAILSLVLRVPLSQFFSDRAGYALASSGTGFQDLQIYISRQG